MFKSCCFIMLHLVLCDTAKILVVIPTPSIGHQNVFKPFTRELANRGHNVTVFCVDPSVSTEKPPPNLEKINVFYKYQSRFSKNISSDVVGKQKRRKVLFNIAYTIFQEDMLLSDEFQKIRHQAYDLIIYESWIEAAIVLSHIFKAPFILMSSLGQDISSYEDVAAPFHPVVYKTFIHEKSYNLSYFEITSQVYRAIEDRTWISTQNADFDEWVKKSTDLKSPSISHLKNNINVLFWTSNPIWDALPVPANVVSIWGLRQQPRKELPDDLKAYLDSSKHGVIYMSFGSIVQPSFLPPEKIQMFVRVFSQLPYDILWKWDQDDLPGGGAKNIKVGKWYPQIDVLGHPKIKVFITHGGLQSTEEAIDAGVPVIGVPMYGDQWYNTEKYVHHNIGFQLKLATLSDEELKKAIDNVITDESYRRNIQRLGSLLRDQPQSTLQRAVWWTEHVLRHSGASHLRTPAANLSWAQYHQIDLLLIIFLSLFIAVTLLVVILHFVYCRLRHYKIKHLN